MYGVVWNICSAHAMVEQGGLPMRRIKSVFFHSSISPRFTHVTGRIAKVLLAVCMATQAASAATSEHFVTTWKTDNPGSSKNTSITVPMIGGPYDVDWDNDEEFDETGLSGSANHNFGVAGTYTIRIRGTFDSIRFNDAGDKEKIVSLDQWGTNSWTSMNSSFNGARNLAIPATDTPDFSAVTDMSYMFVGATSANPDTSGWDTSAVTDMSYMFYAATSANPDTSNWNTSAVTNMQYMFHGATSAVPATSGWDTSAVTDMYKMFANATSANPDTSGWDTSAVTDMSSMFGYASSANPDTSNWDTSSVTRMHSMFSGAIAANPDTSSWDTSAVTDMRFMFYGVTSANPDTSGWNTSSVAWMRGMFGSATTANPDVSGWNTSAVTDMSRMFENAVSFDRDLGSWNVAALTDATSMFSGVTLSTANYDSLLVSWNAQSLQSGVTFSGGNSTYCSEAAIAARENMISSDLWAITDGGHGCPPETCNINMIAVTTEDSDASFEACDRLILGPDLNLTNEAIVSANSGLDIRFRSGFSVETGAILNANVCGQSLCQTSASPMTEGCHSCVDQICDIDSSCCEVEFGQDCLDMVDTVCSLVCE